MEQSEEAAAEAEAKRDGGLRLKRESRVVELQFFERVLEVAVLRAVDGIDAAEYHRLRFSVAGERLLRGIVREGDGVADLRVRERLDGAGDVADLSGEEPVGLFHARRAHDAALDDVEHRAGRHQLELVAGVNLPLFEADVDDDALVAVVVAVKNQRAQGRVDVARRRGDVGDDLLEDVVDIDARFRGDTRRVLCGNADDVLDLGDHAVGVGARQVDLVDDGDDFESAVHREIGVRERLRLDALRRVDDKNRALASRERTRDLVVEVDVTGGVDQVEQVLVAVVGVVDDADGARLDGDASFALQLHIVEELRFHITRGNGVGQLENPVRERALAVVDVRDDAEITYFVLRK